MTVLVTGGAGYIGSHAVCHLIEAGHKVIVIDNLYSGFRWAIHPKSIFYETDMANSPLIKNIINEHRIDAVIHFAAHLNVPESVIKPLKYYENNVTKSLALIRSCYESGLRKFIFSSTAATYGESTKSQVVETDLAKPVSTYGYTKLTVEQILRDLSRASEINKDAEPFRHVTFRYFNAAGARADASLGQATPDAFQLLKVASQAALGVRDKLSIYGNDYPTRDGTCIRDYIHVDDLAHAHVLALNYLQEGGKSDLFNCGYGHGYSVKEVVDVMQKVTGIKFKTEYAARRQGDPGEIVSDSTKLKTTMGWKPQFDNLEYICRTSYEWEKTYQRNYAK